MTVANSVLAGAIVGGAIGIIGGALPLLASLFTRNLRKGLFSFGICVLVGAVAGRYAVTPAAVLLLIEVLRPHKTATAAGGTCDLVFKYGRPLAVLCLLGLILLPILTIVLIGLTLFGFTSKAGMTLSWPAAFLGLVSVAFAWLSVRVVQNGYAFLCEFALTKEGVTIRFRDSSQFVPWTQLSCARYRRAAGQIDLVFSDTARRVILGNVDMDPQRERLRKAVAFIESASGHAVSRSLL